MFNSRKNKIKVINLLMIFLMMFTVVNVVSSTTDDVDAVEEIGRTEILFVLTNGTQYRMNVNDVPSFMSSVANNTIKIVAILSEDGAMGMHFIGGNSEYLYAPIFINGTQMDVSVPYYAFWMHYWFDIGTQGYHFILNADWFIDNNVNPVSYLFFENNSGTVKFWYNVTGLLEGSTVHFANGLKYDGQFGLINEFAMISPQSYTIYDVGFGYHLATSVFDVPVEYRINFFDVATDLGNYRIYFNGTICDNTNKKVAVIDSLPYSLSTNFTSIINNLTVYSGSYEYYNFEFSDVLDAGFTKKFFEIQYSNLTTDLLNVITVLVGAYDLTSEYVEGSWITIDPKIAQNYIYAGISDDFYESPDGESVDVGSESVLYFDDESISSTTITTSVIVSDSTTTSLDYLPAVVGIVVLFVLSVVFRREKEI